MKVLVTGAAGFIGSHVCQQLLDRGDQVVGIDNLNSYYDVSLKQARLQKLKLSRKFKSLEIDVCSIQPSDKSFEDIERIVHLAAQAGVRHSIQHPRDYVDSNIVGFLEVLELARYRKIEHLVYASSSSVYGANQDLPFGVDNEVNHPISLYAATKRANELMAESYSHLFDIPMTGLRFFTVYGPWGRPDMAIFDFTKKIIKGDEIVLYGRGELSRDFTFIDDIVEGVIRCLDKAPNSKTYVGPEVNQGSSPHIILNLGRGVPVTVVEMVSALERELGTVAKIRLVERQPGDVDHTLSDIDATTDWCGYRPATDLHVGIHDFCQWYIYYNKIGNVRSSPFQSGI
jgi:UDP-glucuronate 4-epimerase